MLSKVDAFAANPVAFDLENERIERFIARWQGQEGGQERANYGLFLIELCDALSLPRPDPAGATTEANDYVFERAVTRTGRDGSVSHPRIDLYKRGSFILEAKQSRLAGGRNEVPSQLTLPDMPIAARGRRNAERAWDVLMFNARQQAESYVRLLPAAHEAPPFLVVCDVGHCFEVYANFRRDGRVYDQFPDRGRFRIHLEDLRHEIVRDRLRRIWTDPLSLDPARRSAEVTRGVAERLASVSKALEANNYPTDHVAAFLMRCLFTMFAESVGLLPATSFQALLERCETDPSQFEPWVGQLWAAMDTGGFAFGLGARVRRFNGSFFKDCRVLPLAREEIGELREAAKHDWREVDPSIFGTLLERALDPHERRRLGAHYTPRAFVERLVVATVIEPLRADWLAVLSTAERQKAEGRTKEARATLAAFHDRLCLTRILDPACGTGNFLYVALELMKRLEGEVLEALVGLGGQEALSGLEGHMVGPSQFFGMELNPRAAAIAELVIWIGHLQWHLRTRGGLPNDPVLEDLKTVRVRNAIVDTDAQHPCRPVWPDAEYIVGNPPFMGGKDLRGRLGDGSAEAIWAANPHMNESADLVMYWWDRAASLLTRPGTTLRRFGFVTTNSISQVFQRRVVERHLGAEAPVSIVMSVPDHPWTKATRDAASVRIAMTVCEAGRREGTLREVVSEAGLDTDTPIISFAEYQGIINADLTVGVDVTQAKQLKANGGLAHMGVKLHGAGFILTPAEAAHLGLHRRVGLDGHIKPFRNGRDLTGRSRNAMVIDLFGLAADEVRIHFPEVYQHVLATVKPERDSNNRASYRDAWWTFGEPRRDLRPALAGVGRYIATVRTARHRTFQFVPVDTIAESKLVVIASDDAYVLGVLSSRYHITFSLRAGGWLGVGNDATYNHSDCFNRFPFPTSDECQIQLIRAIAEELDAHRKRVLNESPQLTLTGLYNVLEQLRSGVQPTKLDAADRRIYDDGLVLILHELHNKLDAAVAEAYSWPKDLPDQEILARLVTLSVERAAEEERGRIRWLRPAYQVLRFGSAEQKAELSLTGGSSPGEQGVGAGAADTTSSKPPFPANDIDQTVAVVSMLMSGTGARDATAIASRFRQGRRIEAKVAAVLAAVERTGIILVLDRGRMVV